MLNNSQDPSMADVRPNYAMSIDCANEMEDEVAKTAIKQIKRN